MITSPIDAWKARGWVVGKDGMGPENPKADPTCKKCSGHGILDDGDGYGCVFVDCDCTKEKKP